MDSHSPILLSRDVDAVRIPSGEPAHLPSGAEVIITQELGGTFTVAVTGNAGLFRIHGADADALGRQPSQQSGGEVEGAFDLEKVWEQLRNCYDPEIPVNIVDLGLIYSLEATDDENGHGQRVSIKMTLTAPGCGMGPVIASDAEQRVLSIPGVTSANVEVVWDPPWNPSMISAAGRERLGIE